MPSRLATLCALVAALVCPCCADCCLAPVQAAEPAKRPQVLFIAVDDLNDWIGPLGGYPGVKTPNLDRLAGRSVTFTRAYCAAPACNPSRAAILTGVRPSTSGVYHNDQPWRPVMSKHVTLPQHFMAHGYRAVGCGKIAHGGYDDPQSWHEYFKPKGDIHPAQTPANGIPKAGHFDWAPVGASDADMPDHKMVDWAIEQLNGKAGDKAGGTDADKPLFLAVGFVKPHLPWYAPQKYFDQYPLDQITLPKTQPDDLSDVPAAGRRIARPEGDHKSVLNAKQWEKAVQAYLATISFTDAEIGRLLAALDQNPRGKETIVVLWGDHGWHLGEKEHWRKFALWEEAARVPLFISAPGVSRDGARCERPVNLLDLYPTLAELCGLPAPAASEGVSLAKLVKDPTAAWDRPSLTTHGKDNHAVRSERWRYIRYADGSEELYDHSQDPQEWKNLAGETELAGVKRELAAWLPKTNAANAPSEKDNAGAKGGKKKAKAEKTEE